MSLIFLIKFRPISPKTCLKTHTSLNIINMSENDWTRLLTEDFITMETISETGHNKFKLYKPELGSPSTDCLVPLQTKRFTPWPGLLPLEVADELALHPGEAAQDGHSSVSPVLRRNSQVHLYSLRLKLWCRTETSWMLQIQCHSLTADSLLRLELTNLEEGMSLPSTLITAISLSFIWKRI